MTQKEHLSIDCLFLHDSLMAILEGEQRILRAVVQGDLPAHFLPPLCSLADHIPVYTLSLGEVEEKDGWLFRPVTITPPPATIARYDPHGGMFPPPPIEYGFLLGYAGSYAQAALAAIQDRDELTTEKKVRELRVWYRARMQIWYDFENPVCLGARTSIETLRWERSRPLTSGAKPQ